MNEEKLSNVVSIEAKPVHDVKYDNDKKIVYTRTILIVYESNGVLHKKEIRVFSETFKNLVIKSTIDDIKG